MASIQNDLYAFYLVSCVLTYTKYLEKLVWQTEPGTLPCPNSHKAPSPHKADQLELLATSERSSGIKRFPTSTLCILLSQPMPDNQEPQLDWADFGLKHLKLNFVQKLFLIKRSSQINDWAGEQSLLRPLIEPLFQETDRGLE